MKLTSYGPSKSASTGIALKTNIVEHLYDEVLWVQMLVGCELVAYVDDLRLVSADLDFESLKS